MASSDLSGPTTARHRRGSRHHERPLPGLRVHLDRPDVRQEPRPAQPHRARALVRRRSTGRRNGRGGRLGPTGRGAAHDPRRPRHRLDDRARGGDAGQGPGLRRHRDRRHRRPRRAAGVLHAADAAPRDVPASPRRRYAPRAEVGRGADRAARARGLHPLARQGDRPRRHRPAGLRRPGGRRRPRLDPRLLPLPQVGLRVRPGRPDRCARRRPRPTRSPTGAVRWPARSPS